MKKRIISKILTLLVVFSMVFTLLPVNNKIVHAGDSKVNIGDYIYLGTYQGKRIKMEMHRRGFEWKIDAE